MKLWVISAGKEPKAAESGGNKEWVVKEGNYKQQPKTTRPVFRKRIIIDVSIDFVKNVFAQLLVFSFLDFFIM